MSEIKTIDLNLIDTTADPIPQREAASKLIVKRLAKSISEVGLLQPIGVRKTPAGRYEVLWGRRRLLAFKHLKRSQIEARVVALADIDAEITGTVENMFRSALNKVQSAQATANWVRYQEAKHPTKSGEAAGLGEVLKKNERPRLDQALAETTGVPESTARRQIATAKAFEPGQLDAVAHRDDIADAHLGVIAKLPEAKKAEAIHSLANGASVIEVIQEAKKETKPTREPKIGDKEWLARLDAGIRGKLGANTKAFDKSALLYRDTIEQRNVFHKTSKPALDAAMSSGSGGAFLDMLTMIVAVAHPRDWQVCQVCNGHGDVVKDDKHMTCPKCRKGGFVVVKDKSKVV